MNEYEFRLSISEILKRRKAERQILANLAILCRSRIYKEEKDLLWLLALVVRIIIHGRAPKRFRKRLQQFLERELKDIGAL